MTAPWGAGCWQHAVGPADHMVGGPNYSREYPFQGWMLLLG
ncbi:hypothetical protein [Schaalia cardiffensis]|nr:hypothetical protein [Schaalia cardiffensis]